MWAKVSGLWQTYGCVYLHAWKSGSGAKAGIENWMDVDTRKRSRSTFG
jgi:putative transposase